MPEKISKESLILLEQGLTKTDRSVKSKYTLKQAIEKLFPTLKRLREMDLEWNEIAQKIEELLDHQITVNPSTLQQYYLQIAKTRSKQRSDSEPHLKSRQKQKRSVNRSSLRVNRSDALAIEAGESSIRISDRRQLTSESVSIEAEESPEGTILNELDLNDSAIATEARTEPKATILEELGLEPLEDEAAALRQRRESKFNVMRVTFTDE